MALSRLERLLANKVSAFILIAKNLRLAQLETPLTNLAAENLVTIWIEHANLFLVSRYNITTYSVRRRKFKESVSVELECGIVSESLLCFRPPLTR